MIEEKIKELEEQIAFEKETLKEIMENKYDYPIDKQLSIIAGLQTALAILKA